VAVQAPDLLLGVVLLAAAPDDADFYLQEVQPLLERRCFECHADERRGGLRLTHRSSILAGGDSGPAVEPANPDRSLLLKMVRWTDEFHQMPPKAKLPEEEVAVLERWVRAGAPYDDAHLEAPPDEPQHALPIPEDGLMGWSYQPLRQADIPEIRTTTTSTRSAPIDAFVGAALQRAGLAPAPRSERAALLRRVSYDLTGLPPTTGELEDFLADDSPDAWDKVVERLLAAPQYGERWARHWLDVVRFAETNGFERDSDKPFMWRYRDWVINAFNADMPYDQFVLHQLAGDELDEPTPESLIATGYLRTMQWDDEPGAGGLQGRYDVLADMVGNVGDTFLGMSLGCARCHDHKRDPILQADFYSLMAFFHGVTNMSVRGILRNVSSDEENAEFDRQEAEKKSHEDELQAQRKELEERFSLALAARDGTGAFSPDLTELHYRFYRDTFERLPVFDELKAEDTGQLEGGLIDLSPMTRRESIGFVWEAKLIVPRESEYSFSLASDDGSRLIINGERVIDHDGVHGLDPAREARIRLEGGTVPLRVEYFNRGGGLGLELSWFDVEDELWHYTTEDPGAGWQAPGFDTSTWERGPGGFGSPSPWTRTEWTTPSIWIRKTFHWDPAQGEPVALVRHDEDMDLFINGTLALRRHGYRGEYEAQELTPEGRAALVAGENTIAVRVKNTDGGQYAHARIIPRALLSTARLGELVFGKRPLSVDAQTKTRPPIATLIEQRGAELLGQAEKDRYTSIGQDLDRSRRRKIERKLAPAVSERGPRPEQMHIHVRGNANIKGRPVEPVFPSVFGLAAPDVPKPVEGRNTSGRRRVLAEWITSRTNPLTARVMVNRIWQHHFGRGLVASSNDFGELGDRPTHPELLDWLAREFMQSSWSIKDLHRLILHSEVYRSTSRVPREALQAGLELDPTNKLLWRFEPRRLSAEEVRDSMIALTGKLNLKAGGPSFYEPMPREVLATSSRPDAVWGRSPEEETFRRSLYIKVKRSLLTPILLDFDLADTDSTCPVRFATTQPTQALGMLNSEFALRIARLFAERLQREATAPRDQLELALRLAFQRTPGHSSVDRLVQLRGELMAELGRDERGALEDIALVVLNLNEFLYLD